MDTKNKSGTFKVPHSIDSLDYYYGGHTSVVEAVKTLAEAGAIAGRLFVVDVDGTKELYVYQGLDKEPTKSGAVNSVNGQIGDVVLKTSNIEDDSGKYVVEKIGNTAYTPSMGALGNVTAANKTLIQKSGSVLIGENVGQNINDTEGTGTFSLGNIGIGKNVFQNTPAKSLLGIIAIGDSAYKDARRGNGNIAIGGNAAVRLNKVIDTTIVPSTANQAGGYCNIMGYNAAADAGVIWNSNLLGWSAGSKVKYVHNSDILGNNAAGEADIVVNTVSIGAYTSLHMKLDTVLNSSGNQVILGAYAGSGLNNPGSTDKVGTLTQFGSVYVGAFAACAAKSGYNNVAIGHFAGRAIKGMSNIVMGAWSNYTDYQSTGGTLDGDHNIIFGGKSGNIVGSNNFVAGFFRGNGTGSNNINILGSRNLNASDTLIINSYGNTSSYVPVSGEINIGGTIRGSLYTKNISIGYNAVDTGIAAPRERLDVNGKVISEGYLIGNGTYKAALNTETLTQNTDLKLPNKSGTLATTDDLPKELVLTSPNGTKYKLTVDDDGTLNTEIYGG